MRSPLPHTCWMLGSLPLLLVLASSPFSCDYFRLIKEDDTSTDDTSDSTTDSDDTGDSWDPDDTDTGETSEPVDTGEPGPDVDCDPITPAPLPGPDCLAGTLTCGSFIRETTEGGSRSFDEDIYEAAFCLVPYSSYGGAERAYAFTLPANVVATIRLESPCADLDLILMQWSETAYCPTSDHLIRSCDADDSVGDGVLADMWVRNAGRYLVIVDGKDGAEGNFALSITCEDGG